MPEVDAWPQPVTVRRVGPEGAAAVHAVVRAAFAARPALDPPTAALAETVGSIADALAAGGGLLAEGDGHPVGALVLDPEPARGRVWVRRFGVVPAWQAHGVGARMVETVIATTAGQEIAVLAREELPRAQAFWAGHGFVEVGRTAPYVEMVRPAALVVPDADAMRDLGRRLAGLLRAGDLLVLTGGLGAGKTTFTQGLGAGLGVRGDVTSPTFVIARVHPSTVGGPELVHVDAYRLGGAAELDDLDLDTSLEDAVTVVEWGAGLAEQLADDRLEVVIERNDTDDVRLVRVTGYGARWADVDVRAALA